LNGYMEIQLVMAEGRLFGLDAQLINDALILGVNIFIIFIAASYLLFNPARQLLKKRQDKIQSDLDSAAADKEKAAALITEYEARIANINAEAEVIMAEARRKAKLNETQIIDTAREEANIIKRRAEAEIELERKRAIEDMKLEIIQIASQLATKAVNEQMNVKVSDALVDETLKEMGVDTWQSR